MLFIKMKLKDALNSEAALKKICYKFVKYDRKIENKM